MDRPGYYARLPRCGCFVIVGSQPKWLPLVDLDVRTSLLSSSTRTLLTQTFTNTDSASPLKEVRYSFPLYDGVSVVGFRCTIGERVITGVVKERQAAAKAYDDAVDRGQAAGLLHQSQAASDVFIAKLGNVPAGTKVTIAITYLGELEHDAQVDGLRLTIPASIAPRYDAGQTIGAPQVQSHTGGKMSVTVDAQVADGCAITSVQSPTHPISVRIGHTSATTAEAASLTRASASLALGSSQLDKDVVIQIAADGLSNPAALLEEHPTLPHRRALMTTLVPKFSLPSEKPEVVFVCDRSGSMGSDQKMPNLVAALQIFLKSLPVGVRFNVCSFGSRYEFLWDRSRLYDSQETLDVAVEHVGRFAANFGGTEMYEPVDEAFKRRYADMNLEVFLLTDGEIWEQEKLFKLINDGVQESKGAIRVFTLGVGDDVSSALIQGVARAGNGFSQQVAADEKMDKKVIRMLKGALTPHITDYALEVRYGGGADGEGNDFEVVERVMDVLCLDVAGGKPASTLPAASGKPISLFDPATKDRDMQMPDAAATIDANFDGLPAVPSPRYLQAPFKVPALFPFHRATVYVMLSDATPTQRPTSVVLTGTSAHGPLRLEIPVTTLEAKGSTVHQLAARKAVQELEEGRGWMTHATDAKGDVLKKKYEGQFERMVQREAVSLCVEFQVGGKWCSFVAVQEGKDAKGEERIEGDELEVVHAEGPASARPPTLFMAGRYRARQAAVASPAHAGGFGRSAAAPASLGASEPRRRGWVGLEQEDGSGGLGDETLTAAGANESGAALGASSQAGATPLAELASLQRFTGSWSWSAELERVLGMTEGEAGGKVPGVSGDTLATLCAVSYLRTKLAAEADAWELMVAKAEAWLEQETGETREALVRRGERGGLFG